jgi:hypothetical protein
MKSSPKSDSLFEQITARMSPEAVAKFTPSQLEDLKQACRQLSWKKHAVDVRVSIPLPGRGFYFVFLAGPERRSLQRLRAENPFYPYGVIAGCLGLLAAAGVGVNFLWNSWLQPTLATDVSTMHETAIPWLQSKVSCEGTGRIWRDSTCWDKQHNPNF